MKRGWWIVLFVLFMVASVGLVALRHEREPEYEGKTLSEWLGPAGLKVGWGYREVAVGQIGTNALPFLLRWIQYETPWWRKAVSGVGEKLQIPILRTDAAHELYIGESAVLGFEILGSAGKGAIPELVVLSGSKHSMTRGRAGRALGAIGADAVPVLLSMVTNQAVQGNADLTPVFWGWQSLGEDVNLGVPMLLELVKSTNAQVAGASARMLGFGHVQPEIVVPALSNAVYASDPWARACALNGLAAFGVQARGVRALLVTAAGDPSYNVRWEATNALLRIAPEMLQTNR